MNTYLGISAELGPEDVNLEVAASTDIVFWKDIFLIKIKVKRLL